MSLKPPCTRDRIALNGGEVLIYKYSDSPKIIIVIKNQKAILILEDKEVKLLKGFLK
jgi:hypothetical protein